MKENVWMEQRSTFFYYSKILKPCYTHCVLNIPESEWPNNNPSCAVKVYDPPTAGYHDTSDCILKPRYYDDVYSVDEELGKRTEKPTTVYKYSKPGGTLPSWSKKNLSVVRLLCKPGHCIHPKWLKCHDESADCEFLIRLHILNIDKEVRDYIKGKSEAKRDQSRRFDVKNKESRTRLIRDLIQAAYDCKLIPSENPVVYAPYGLSMVTAKRVIKTMINIEYPEYVIDGPKYSRKLFHSDLNYIIEHAKPRQDALKMVLIMDEPYQRHREFAESEREYEAELLADYQRTMTEGRAKWLDALRCHAAKC